MQLDIDKPLKETTSNSRFVLNNGVAQFKPALGYVIAYMILKMAVYGFWLIFFYDVFVEDLDIIDQGPAPWFWAPVATILAIFITIGFWFAGSDFKSKRYFNLKTGYFRVPDVENELFENDDNIDENKKARKQIKKLEKQRKRGRKIDEINSLQLLIYEKRMQAPKMPSGYLADIFELNLVMTDGKRYNICAYLKREKAEKVINELGQFLNKSTNLVPSSTKMLTN